MSDQVISLTEQLAKITKHWQPVVINQGDFGFRLVKFVGDFEWHKHEHSDKAILVLAGEMGVKFLDDTPDVMIKANEIFVLKKGVHHKPFAHQECSIVLIEQAGLGD